MNTKLIGYFGERESANALRNKGYEIIAANFHSRFGEIDLIAANNKYLVFCEVKTRKSKDFGQARESVTYTKQQKTIKTAEFYLLSRKDEKRQPRFDVIEVYYKFSDDKIVLDEINHIENAYEVV